MTREYCDNPSHKNDPDWSYIKDVCPYCQLEAKDREIEGLKGLIDGCMEVVELFGTTPAQLEWKAKWLALARKVVVNGGGER